MLSSSPEGVTSGGGARALSVDDAEFPASLRELRDVPRTIHVRGSLLAASSPAVAIVGTRNATPYGLRVARALAALCARHGVSVISGLARGIDVEAHRSALAEGGRTVAVLGTAIDHYYPKSHREWQERIAREGLLISEHAPGDPGHAGSFPRRNRIIAALAQVTVVVEAPENSGALITAEHALALGRTVFVVPNAMDVPQARGSNALVRMNANLMCDPVEVIHALKVDVAPPRGPVLSDDAALCWDAIVHGAQDTAAIARQIGWAPRKATAVLALLEIDGLVTVDNSGLVHPTVGV